MSEKDCRLVCSRGILKSCDIHSKMPVSSIRRLIEYDYGIEMDDENDNPVTIYICSSAIPEFRRILYSIPYRFILVTGDCDESCWEDLFGSKNDFLMFIENDKIIHWFSQNCTGSHPKLTQIPIGMDYHTMSNRDTSWGPRASPREQEMLLLAIAKTAKPWNERKHKTMAYSNFHFALTTKFAQDRRDAIAQIPAECIFYEPEHCIRIKSWKTQIEYSFIISPHGGGLDCHRTWEALALGCIPIVKTSALDPLFEGLPVWIVKEWSDVSKKSMTHILKDFSNKNAIFSYDKMNLAYWMEKIRAK